MNEKTYQTADQVTEEMKQEWQERFHTSVRTIDVPVVKDGMDTGIKARFFIRKPDRTVLDQISKASADRDFAKCNSLSVKNCVLGGDMQYLVMEDAGGNDQVFFAVLEAVGELLEKKKAIFLD